MKHFLCITITAILFISWTNSFSEPLHTNFAYIGDTNHAAYKGATQGLKEANLQGEFLGLQYSIDPISVDEIKKSDLDSYIAILVQADESTLTSVSSLYPDIPVFNLTLINNDLRQACIKNVLHIIPSEKMLFDAQKQWLQKEPESNATAHAWHPDFVKFAARDLNKRFKKLHDIKMDDYSWAAWAAVKMTSDTVARTKITDPTELLNYLKSELSFDGQKGSDMNFRETGQLRQLILLVENNKIVAEAPVRGVAKPPTLDSLGNLSCEK